MSICRLPHKRWLFLNFLAFSMMNENLKLQVARYALASYYYSENRRCVGKRKFSFKSNFCCENKNFNLNMAVMCMWMWITNGHHFEFFWDTVVVRNAKHKKLTKISLLQVCFMLIRIKKSFLKKYSNFKLSKF